jgi:Mrp family chromosome partitioning ATPase
MLKTTSVGTSTGVGSQQQQPKQQQSLTTANQTVGSGARGLSGVKKVILVYSGKGGVGKSSVAVNLAAAMSQLPSSSSSPTTTSTSSTNNKLNIGLFDADIFGPSLPSLIDVMSLSQGIIGSDGIDPTPPATSQSIDLQL